MRAGELVADRYRIRGLLGRGGMGSVWQARDETLNRDVAVKFLEAIQGEESLRRFRREGQLLARLRHPGLVEVYECGVDEGRPFIAQELVEGQDLAVLFRGGGAMAVDEVQRLARELASALAYLHGEGVLHRDIKPANVFRRSDGRFVLLDFGLARAADQTIMTVTGELVGTPIYMPPQQLAGEPADEAADVYGVGLVLHEAATGELYHGRVTDLYDFMVDLVAGHQVLSRAAETLPQDLRRLLGRCCAREPADRPRNGGELLALVEKIWAPPGSRAPVARARAASVLPESGRGEALTVGLAPVEPQATRARWRRVALVGFAVLLLAGLVAGWLGRTPSGAGGPGVEPLEWVQWTDGFDLVLPRPAGGTAAWRLTPEGGAVLRGAASVEGGTLRVELRGLPGGLRGELTVEAGGRSLGAWAVALPAEDLATAAWGRFGPTWIEVGWGLHGRGGATLEVEPQGLPKVQRWARGRVERVDVPLADGLPRPVAWRLRRGERLLASGQGQVGGGRRTSLITLSGLPELSVPLSWPPSAFDDRILVAAAPGFLACLRPLPSPSGTTLVESWAVALSRQGLPRREAVDPSVPGYDHPLVAALPLEDGDALVVSRAGEGYVGRLRGRVRRAVFEGQERPSWRLLWDGPVPDEGEVGEEPRITLHGAVESVRTASLRPDVQVMVASLASGVEPWVADTGGGGLALRRGEALPGAGVVLAVAGVGGRFAVVVTVEAAAGEVTLWSLDARPTSGPRVVGRTPLGTRRDFFPDAERQSAVATAVGPGRVIVGAGRGLFVVDLDEGGRPRMGRVAVDLDDTSQPQSVHVTAGGRVQVMGVHRYHHLANLPCRFQAVLLEPGGSGAGGYAVAVRSPEVGPVVPAAMLAGSAWLERGGLLWAMPGSLFLGLSADAKVATRFQVELPREDNVGPLVAAGGAVFALTRDGGVLGCDMDAAGGR